MPAELEEQMYQHVRMTKLRRILADPSLTKLDVSGIGFGTEGALAVAEAVRGNLTATVLDISGNKMIAHSDFGGASGKGIGAMLAANITLTEVNVSGNTEYSSTKGCSFARELVAGLKQNDKVSVLVS
jgi:hypothetical protein